MHRMHRPSGETSGSVWVREGFDEVIRHPSWYFNHTSTHPSIHSPSVVKNATTHPWGRPLGGHPSWNVIRWVLGGGKGEKCIIPPPSSTLYHHQFTCECLDTSISFHQAPATHFTTHFHPTNKNSTKRISVLFFFNKSNRNSSSA